MENHTGAENEKFFFIAIKIVSKQFLLRDHKETLSLHFQADHPAGHRMRLVSTNYDNNHQNRAVRKTTKIVEIIFFFRKTMVCELMNWKSCIKSSHMTGSVSSFPKKPMLLNCSPGLVDLNHLI